MAVEAARSSFASYYGFLRGRGTLASSSPIVTIRRQTYPGAGGLVTKQTKGRDICHVPILQALKPVLERLTHERELDERLLTGPRGGVLTTASVRDATKWDQLVTELELPSLTRHGLRHTGATWLADAGIPLHVLHGILGHKSIETTRGYSTPTPGTSPTPPHAPTRSSTDASTPDMRAPHRPV